MSSNSDKEEMVIESERNEVIIQHVKILINNLRYTTQKNPIKVAEVKALAEQPLDHNCYRIVRGKSEGPLPNELSLTLHHGDRFTINCGEDPSS